MNATKEDLLIQVVKAAEELSASLVDNETTYNGNHDHTIVEIDAIDPVWAELTMAIQDLYQNYPDWRK